MPVPTFGKEVSKIKIVIMTTGKNQNPAFYNFSNLNKYSNDYIIKKMKDTVKKSPAYLHKNKILIYSSLDNFDKPIYALKEL